MNSSALFSALKHHRDVICARRGLSVCKLSSAPGILVFAALLVTHFGLIAPSYRHFCSYPRRISSHDIGGLCSPRISPPRWALEKEEKGRLLFFPLISKQERPRTMLFAEGPETSSNVPFTPEVSAKLASSLRSAASELLSYQDLLNWMFPQLKNRRIYGSTKNSKETPSGNSEVPSVLNDAPSSTALPDINKFFEDALELTAQDALSMAEQPPVENYDINEALESELVMKDFIFQQASPIVEGVSWDPLGMQLEDSTLIRKQQIQARVDELLKDADQLIPRNDLFNKSPTSNSTQSEGILDKWKDLPADFPTATLQFFREYQGNDTSLDDTEHKIKQNPSRAIKRLAAAVHEFDSYIQKLEEDVEKVKAQFDDFDDKEKLVTPIEEEALSDPRSVASLKQLIPPYADEYPDYMGEHAAKKLMELGREVEEKGIIKGLKFRLKKLSPKTLHRGVEWMKDSEVAKRNEKLVGFTYAEFDEELKNEIPFLYIRPGDLVKGEVINVAKDKAWINIGTKSLATLSVFDAFHTGFPIPKNGLKDFIQPGDVMIFQVTRLSSKDTDVSLKQIHEFRAWDLALKTQASRKTLGATIKQVNRGGAIVDILGLKGFLPNSQVSDEVAPLTLENIGDEVLVKVVNVDIEDKKLIVSNKMAILYEGMKTICQGALIEGTVSVTLPYGVIVKFGQCTGLLHVSQISNSRGFNFKNIFPVGCPVKAIVTEYDEVSGRVSLSTKLLESYPGEILTHRDRVFSEAENIAKFYQAHRAREKNSREEAARDLVSSLGFAALEPEGSAIPTVGEEDDVKENLPASKGTPFARNAIINSLLLQRDLEGKTIQEHSNSILSRTIEELRAKKTYS